MFGEDGAFGIESWLYLFQFRWVKMEVKGPTVRGQWPVRLRAPYLVSN